MALQIKEFFDHDTATFSYVVTDSSTKATAVIDPVMNYNQFSGNVTYSSVQNIIEYIQDNNLNLDWILETHIHADHLTAATVLKNRFGGRIGIGSDIIRVLDYWVPFFNMETEIPVDASQFDILLKDNEKIKLGNLEFTIIHTPGHTPACVSYIIEDAIFVGDTIFMPDVGTARADFPGGDAYTLYNSIRRILCMPAAMRVFVCHDYPPNKREIAFHTTVGEQNEKNIMINRNISIQEFISIRNERDKSLSVPKLLFPSLQVNLYAGNIVNGPSNIKKFLKIPVTIN